MTIIYKKMMKKKLNNEKLSIGGLNGTLSVPSSCQTLPRQVERR